MISLGLYIIFFALLLAALFLLFYFGKKWRSGKIIKFPTNDFAIDQIEVKYQQIKVSVARLDNS